MTVSRSPQYRAFSRAVMDEKSLSPLFSVGVCVCGGGGEGQWLQMTGALAVRKFEIEACGRSLCPCNQSDLLCFVFQNILCNKNFSSSLSTVSFALWLAWLPSNNRTLKFSLFWLYERFLLLSIIPRVIIILASYVEKRIVEQNRTELYWDVNFTVSSLSKVITYIHVQWSQ